MTLSRKLDKQHTIFINPMFPHRVRDEKKFRYSVVLGVGGNVGDIGRRLNHLWIYLGRLVQLQRVQSGVILKNPPFGYTQQADFYNTVIEIATSLQPRVLLRLVWRIEKRFGRRRSFPNAPRTLDVDILFFDNRSIHYPELTIPHPHWGLRSSVKIPLRSMNRTFRRHYENLNV
ncbi:MAG: 2-amino-4-hydroxy-6-hydroxymethyldihydropteridine diphosphokinase [Campylobacterales bacterium]|nr:2-amino-4-hydroxy-6-hydroxymethyldihydropteridine diphosphokinase [Campylobacterales bacterium]